MASLYNRWRVRQHRLQSPHIGIVVEQPVTRGPENPDRRLSTLKHSSRRVDHRFGNATKVQGDAAPPPGADESEQLADLQRILGAKPQRFRVQFFGVAGARSPTILTESEIWAAEAPDVIREAASIAWPVRAIGLRVLDQEGREVFERLKANH
jgi:hypothetical protein